MKTDLVQAALNRVKPDDRTMEEQLLSAFGTKTQYQSWCK
jgi:hypothetical protein